MGKGLSAGVGWEWAWAWMERRRKERGRGEPRCHEPPRSTRPPADGRSQRTAWPQTLKACHRWRSWCGVALVGAVWSVCQVEAPLHPSLSPAEACWRLLLVCVLWTGLGGCGLALKYCLRLRQRAEPLQRIQEVVTEQSSSQYSGLSRARAPGRRVPLALALADSLLLCVLQEPLPDPGVPHIQALLSRLESVSETLERADIVSESWLEEANRADSSLTDKVKVLSAYLQQRTRSLRRLVRVQGEFEASAKDVLAGLDGLWAQLEELHTGVTLTKEWSPGNRDLSAARTEAEGLFVVLARHKSRLQCCRAHQEDSTQLLQELAWSHTHISHSVSGGGESVWPELLLQSNIEQFDKVQEGFLSLEQQTSTFQAHLEGLGGGDGDGPAGPPSLTDRAPCSCSASPPTSPCLCSGRPADVSTETSTPAPPPDADTPLTLCERSALQVSSAFGRLRRSGRRK